MIDAHTHLDSCEPPNAELVAAAREAGVTRVLTVGTDEASNRTALAAAEAFGEVWAAVGRHPNSAEGFDDAALEDLRALAGHPRCAAIGETGLDYYRLAGRTVADMEWQRERFRTHIRAARITGLPLVVHTRNASHDTLDLLRSEGAGLVCGVFHCFTETREVALAALEMGFHISFSGILTFRNAEDLRQVAREVPLDRCLIETDSPYLAPMPHRGKTNQPAFVPLVAAKLAEIKGLSLAQVAQATSANFERLFGLVQLQKAERNHAETL